MACPNFKNGQENGLRPLGVKVQRKILWEKELRKTMARLAKLVLVDEIFTIFLDVTTLNTSYIVGHTIFSTLYSVCKLDEK
jgi:hypothetical protein